MAGFTYATSTTAIQNYTEVGTSVLSSTITDKFIDNSELRIQREITIVPTPSSAFMYKIHYNARPVGLSSANTTTYLRLNFGNGLLYACLVEAFSYLKGPQDMLQLYEQKYQTEAQKFGGEQIGRRRRDDYTDGEPRIPVQSPAP